MKPCPYCAEEIQDAAVFCKHCRRDLAQSPGAAPSIAMEDSFIPLLGEGSVLSNRYQLERRVGKGGMAVVWAALDPRLNRRVAIKTIPSIVMEDKRLRRALEDEARLVMELHHERIRAVYGLEEDARAGSYLVMELVEGLSLDDVLAERPAGKLTPDEAVEIGRQICEGVEYAHSKGVIHRDLKPKNLFLVNVSEEDVRLPLDTSRIQIKVMDFGLGVRVRDSVVSRSGFTNTSGTLAYMSPEQLNGAKPHVSMDVYGLGATLYELLTGEAPLTGGDVAGQILRMPVPRIQEVPSWLADFVEACLGKTADLRPSSMATARSTLAPRSSPEQPIGFDAPARKPQGSTPAPSEHGQRGSAETSGAKGAGRTPRWSIILLASLLSGTLVVSAPQCGLTENMKFGTISQAPRSPASAPLAESNPQVQGKTEGTGSGSVRTSVNAKRLGLSDTIQFAVELEGDAAALDPPRPRFTNLRAVSLRTVDGLSLLSAADDRWNVTTEVLVKDGKVSQRKVLCLFLQPEGVGDGVISGLRAGHYPATEPISVVVSPGSLLSKVKPRLHEPFARPPRPLERPSWEVPCEFRPSA